MLGKKDRDTLETTSTTLVLSFTLSGEGRGGGNNAVTELGARDWQHAGTEIDSTDIYNVFRERCAPQRALLSLSLFLSYIIRLSQRYCLLMSILNYFLKLKHQFLTLFGSRSDKFQTGATNWQYRCATDSSLSPFRHKENIFLNFYYCLIFLNI